MKVRAAFTEKKLLEIKKFFANNMKDPHYNEKACIAEVLEQVLYDVKDHYELGGFFTKSGNPTILDFSDSDFIFEEIDE